MRCYTFLCARENCVVYGWGSRAHVGTGTLKELGWLLVSDRVRYFAMLHAFRIRKGSAPPYLSRNFVHIAGVHSYQTRGSAFDFHISGDDTTGGFSYFSKVQWNGLPVHLKSIDNIDLFKAKLKQHLMDNY